MKTLDHEVSDTRPPATSSAQGEVTSKRNTIGTSWMEPLFICRLILGAIFLAASMDKIMHPGAFAQIIYNYQLLPDSAINLIAIVLPWLELILGIVILVGFWLPGAVLLADLLMLTFFTALLINLVRGLDVHCGCFSTASTGQVSTWLYVLRDALFFCIGGFLFLKVFAKPSHA